MFRGVLGFQGLGFQCLGPSVSVLKGLKLITAFYMAACQNCGPFLGLFGVSGISTVIQKGATCRV